MLFRSGYMPQQMINPQYPQQHAGMDPMSRMGQRMHHPHMMGHSGNMMRPMMAGHQGHMPGYPGAMTTTNSVMPPNISPGAMNPALSPHPQSINDGRPMFQPGSQYRMGSPQYQQGQHNTNFSPTSQGYPPTPGGYQQPLTPGYQKPPTPQSMGNPPTPGSYPNPSTPEIGRAHV